MVLPLMVTAAIGTTLSKLVSPALYQTLADRYTPAAAAPAPGPPSATAPGPAVAPAAGPPPAATAAAAASPEVGPQYSK
jgi:hypothetical protein